MKMWNKKFDLDSLKMNQMNVVELPADAIVLSCASQNQKLVIYFSTSGECETNKDVQFLICETGSGIDVTELTQKYNYAFIGTVHFVRSIMDDGGDNGAGLNGDFFYVVHVFMAYDVIKKEESGK